MNKEEWGKDYKIVKKTNHILFLVIMFFAIIVFLGVYYIITSPLWCGGYYISNFGEKIKLNTDMKKQILKGGNFVDRKLKIIVKNCPQNHKCPAVNVCPVSALSQKDFEAPKIDYDKCIKCGKCSNFCPKKALVLD